MSNSYSQDLLDAWSKLGFGQKGAPAEVWPQFTKKDFEQLKADWVKEYGYTIRIPQIDDIIHMIPRDLRDPAEIKREKQENLIRLLESPAPDWARSYSSAMAWIDDVQDTASIAYPALHYVFRAAPKAFGKVISVFGWLLMGYDLLNLANAIGRAPLSPMKAKREACKFWKTNPFGKKMLIKNIDRIKKWKPNLADAIQAAQVTDQLFGVGLSLGGMMGVINDSIFGLYRYVTGQPVRFSTEAPSLQDFEKLSLRGHHAVANISTQGQTFSESVHFWSHIAAGAGSVLSGGVYRTGMLSDVVEDPMNISIPAPEPTDPITRAVIEEQGLNIEKGARWPYNGQKNISLGDWMDSTVEPARANTINYLNRHSKDMYGYAAATALDYLTPHNILAADPGADITVDDTDQVKIFWKMVKTPVLPVTWPTEEQSNAFWLWCDTYKVMYGKIPGAQAIGEKLQELGIEIRVEYALYADPSYRDWWMSDFGSGDTF